MAQQKGVRRFNKTYYILNELFRRIYDVDHDYPAHTCALWFVQELNNLLSNATLRSMLTIEQVDNLAEKGNNLIRTSLLEGKVKKELKLMVTNLEEAKADLLGVNHAK